MGFLKKLARSAGKLGKAVIKYAPAIAAGGPVSLTAIAASKMRSFGENRTRSKLAEKLRGSEGLGKKALAIKVTADKPLKASAPKPLPTLGNIKGQDLSTLGISAKQKTRAGVQASASLRRQASARWKLLDPDAQAALKESFKAAYPTGGSTNQWTSYIVDNG